MAYQPEALARDPRQRFGSRHPFQPGEQRSHVLFVVLPSSHRRAEDRLAHLHGAGRSDRSLCPVEFHAAWLPREATPSHEFPSHTFQIGNRLLVVHFQQRRRQDLPPVLHDPFVLVKSRRNVRLGRWPSELPGNGSSSRRRPRCASRDGNELTSPGETGLPKDPDTSSCPASYPRCEAPPD